MSEFSRVYVRRIGQLTQVPGTDFLMHGQVDGLNFLVNKNDGAKEGDLAVIVPFDMIVPNTDDMPEFVRGQRIRPKKLRGIVSMCVCLPNICGYEEDRDVTSELGFVKWEPKPDNDDGIELQNGHCGHEIRGPFELLHYDIESLAKYHNEFKQDEDVLYCEKIEGECISITYHDDQFWVRSRKRWIEKGDNKWWNSVEQYDWNFLKDYPWLVVFGEKYGNVSQFRYDCNDGQQKICVFDLYDQQNRRFYSIDEFLDFTDKHKIITAPILARGPWQGLEHCRGWAETKPVFGGDIREGIVVRSDQLNSIWGRKIYKLHSNRWLLHRGKLN